jgi:hypothetical protein
LAAVTLETSRTPRGVLVYSLPTEDSAVPSLAFTDQAWLAFMAWKDRLLADRCAMRVQLQVANGGQPDPDPVCAGAK